MSSMMSPLVKETLTFMAYYLGIGLPLTYFGSKYLIKLKQKNDVKATKISYVLITAPLLMPMLIGMFGVMFYVLGLIVLTIFPEPPDNLAIPAMLLGGVTSIYLGIKAYIAIYKSYMNDNKNENIGAS